MSLIKYNLVIWFIILIGVKVFAENNEDTGPLKIRIESTQFDWEDDRDCLALTKMDSLFDLIGLDASSPIVAEKLDCLGYHEMSEYDDSYYLIYYAGIEFRIEKSTRKLSTLFAHNGREDKAIAPYKGELPFGLNFYDSQFNVWSKLGTPLSSQSLPSKVEPGSFETWWEVYKVNSICIRVTYGTSIHPGEQISYIALYGPECKI